MARGDEQSVRKQFVPTCFCLKITYDEGHSVYQTDFMKAAALGHFLPAPLNNTLPHSIASVFCW